jgi:hypothetical protein
VPSSAQREDQINGHWQTPPERRVRELVEDGRLLSYSEIGLVDEALALAVSEGRLSWHTLWVCADDDVFDSTIKDRVRKLLGEATAGERRIDRRVQLCHFERALERRRAMQGECRDHRALTIVAAGETSDRNACHARSVLRAITAGVQRRAGSQGVAHGRSRRRRPGRRTYRRSSRTSRAGPGESDGEPALGRSFTRAQRRYTL